MGQSCVRRRVLHDRCAIGFPIHARQWIETTSSGFCAICRGELCGRKGGSDNEGGGDFEEDGGCG